MSAAKVIGIGCGGCLGLMVIAAVVGFVALPNAYEIERSVVIDAPPTAVFPLVNTPSRWPEWDAWAAIDPDTENEYSGPESGVGATRSWTSEDPNVGEGTFTITESVENERVVLALTFPQMESSSTSTFTFTREGAGTRVVWSDEAQDLSGVMRVFALAADSFIGPQFAAGLSNLEELAEAEADVGDAVEDQVDQIEEKVDEALEEAASGDGYGSDEE